MSQPAITKFFASTPCNRDRQPKKRKTGHNKPSAIESLPTELIEKIFVYSLNTSFTRASPRLAAALSSERVYRLLIMLAFWDNDDYGDHKADSNDNKRYEGIGTRTWKGIENFNIPRILRPLGHDYVPISHNKRHTLQWAIIRRRWCTIDRIRSQLPDLARLILTQRCFDAGYAFEDEDKGRELDEMLQSGTPRKFRGFAYRKVANEPGQHKTEGNIETCQIIVRPGEFIQFYFYSTYVKSPLESLSGPTKSLWYPILSLTRIPDFFLTAEINSNERGLVRNCFTDTHLKFLETIIYSGQVLPISQCEEYLRPLISQWREDTQRGIHIAISTINPVALDRMLRIDEALYRKPIRGGRW